MFSERNALGDAECPHTCIITICCQRFWIFIHMARKSPSHGKKNRSSLPHVARKIIYLSSSHGKKNNIFVFLAWQEKLIGLVFLTWQENRLVSFHVYGNIRVNSNLKGLGGDVESNHVSSFPHTLLVLSSSLPPFSSQFTVLLVARTTADYDTKVSSSSLTNSQVQHS